MVTNEGKKACAQDIARVMKSEQARGVRRRPLDPEALEKWQTIMWDMGALLKIKEKETLLRILSEDYGLRVGSEQYKNALQAWNEAFQRRQRSSGISR